MAEPEKRSVIVNIGEDEKQLTPDNCEIFRFRHDGEYDYLHVFDETQVPDQYEHTIVFRNRNLLVWMGGAVLLGDLQHRIEREMGGQFTDLSGGWRPMTHVVDEPTESEKEMYAKMLLKDLNEADSPPQDWT